MPNSTPWCSASANFPLDWRPSRWLVGALLLIAALAPFAILQSEMPRHVAWPLAVTAASYGLWRAWREARKSPRIVVLPLAETTLHWRGPLLFVRVQGEHFGWWPDTLDEDTRQQLRRAGTP